MTTKTLHQYMTPAWAALRIREIKFPRLTSSDVMVDAACGDGAWLAAMPPHVRAVGVDIDPVKVREAIHNTGREVLVGDLRTVRLPIQPTLILGNPPFRHALVESLMGRAQEWLPEGGTMGLILSAHIFQNAARSVDYGQRWEICVEQLPKNLWPRLTYPLVFATFKKGARRGLVGFLLYDETTDVGTMSPAIREALQRITTDGGTWYEVVKVALAALGGTATTDEVYAFVRPRRPTTNRWWKAKVRQQLRRFPRVAPCTYAVSA